MDARERLQLQSGIVLAVPAPDACEGIFDMHHFKIFLSMDFWFLMSDIENIIQRALKEANVSFCFQLRFCFIFLN
jgi:hypothetical protein